jgi:hypothetical protein
VVVGVVGEASAIYDKIAPLTRAVYFWKGKSATLTNSHPSELAFWKSAMTGISAAPRF